MVVAWGFAAFCLTSAGLAMTANSGLLLGLAALQGVATSYFSNPTMLIVLEITTNETRQDQAPRSASRMSSRS